MKVRKFFIALIEFFGVIGVVSTNQVDAASINSLAKKYQYSGVTYLYKMLKLEGIKYNEFPGVEYQNGKPELMIPVRLLTMKQFTLTVNGIRLMLT